LSFISIKVVEKIGKLKKQSTKNTILQKEKKLTPFSYDDHSVNLTISVACFQIKGKKVVENRDCYK
jgi:hypothetical protein